MKAADREKRKILALYRDDIAKHARRYSEKVRRIFDEIPGQLSRHEKKFELSIPLEVKSSKRYTTKSLDKFVGKYKSKIDTPIILHAKDLKIEKGILHLPLYMTSVL